MDLEDLLGCEVDVVAAASLRLRVAARVLADATRPNQPTTTRTEPAELVVAAADGSAGSAEPVRSVG